MGSTAEFHPDWKGWAWVRRGLLLLMVAFMGWAGWSTYTRDELVVGESLWLVLLGTTVVAMAWSKQPSAWAVVFVTAFTVMRIGAQLDYQGAAWFALYAVLTDVNTRRPAWPWFAFPALLLGTNLVLQLPVSVTITDTLYVLLLTLLGQFTRMTFAGSRAASYAAGLESSLQRAKLREAVHDSAGARLTQVLVLARSLYKRADLSAGVRRDLATLVEVAWAGATELRAVMNPRSEWDTTHRNPVGREWVRAVLTLRASGFDVAESVNYFPRLAPRFRDEAVRVIREATTNICKHALPSSRVAMTMTAGHDEVVFVWFNERCRPPSGPQPPSEVGLGIAGMRKRVAALGGTASVLARSSEFGLRVTIPAGGPTHG